MTIWAELRSPFRRAVLGTLIIFLVLFAIWWQVTSWYAAQLLSEQRAEATAELSLRGNVLSSVLNRRFARLQGLGAFAQMQPEIEDFGQAFTGFAETLYEDAVGVRSFSLAPDGTVLYIYPRAGNEALLGYRPLTDGRAEVRGDVRRAMRTGDIVLSVPDSSDGLGLSAYQAVYKGGNFWGLVRVELDVTVLLDEVGLNERQGALAYALRDSTGRVLFGDPALFVQDPVINLIELPGGTWELAGAPRSGWPATLQPALSIFRLVGLSIVFLLSALAFLTINRQARLQAAVAQRTRELARVNAGLEQRVQERTRELETLLDVARTVSATLELQPLLDLLLEQLRVVIDFVSAGVYLLEKEEGELLLRLVHYEGPISEETLEERWPGRRRPLQAAAHQEKVVREGPVLVDDVRADTPLAAACRQSMAYLGEELAYARSWMGVPLRARNRTIGMLAFDHPHPAHYSQRDVDLAMAFAAQAAIAIENARLYTDARSLAVLQERQRLARELHDSVSQALYGISLGTLTARRLLEQGKGKEAADPLAYTHTLAEAALTEMRALIFELRPESLEREGLAAALEKQAAALRARHGIGVETDLCQEPAAPLPVKEALYRVAQEALNNVVKHADADSVTLHLLCVENRLALTIHDTGRGFDPGASYPGHLGLSSMRERMEQIGGRLSVTSAPGAGTTVQAEALLDGNR